MKKIYLSILSIVATIGIVSGAAYALFTDTVTVSGLTVSTGNADLQINVENSNAYTNYKDSIDLATYGLNNLFPGAKGDELFYLRNISNGAFYLRPSVRLTAAGGDWNALKDIIEINITDTDDSNYSWGWRTLAWWNSEDRTISNTPGIAPESNPTVDPENSHRYKVEVRIPSSADNTISGKTLSNVTFVITGTQVNL